MADAGESFLRANGLSLLSRAPIFKTKASGIAEEAKPVIRASLFITLMRLSIHIPPILTSITLIALNLGRLFLGMNLPGKIYDNAIAIAILQVLAKLQELLIIASLTTVVFTVVRDHLIFGDGVPLGFLCSGFTFSQLSYFWSVEFWAAVRAPVHRRQKVAMIGVLLLAGLLAATAGPSSAVLLVPRQQTWIAGGGDFYLRGSASDLFPSTLRASPSDFPTVCFGLDAVNHAMCPSGGFRSLYDYALHLPKIKNGANLRPLPKSISGQFDVTTIDIASTTATIPRSRLWGCPRGLACQTAVTAPYLPVSMYQNQLFADWEDIIGNIMQNPNDLSSSSRAEYAYGFWDETTLSTQTRIPVVRTACSMAQNLSSDAVTVNFPVMREYACWDGFLAVPVRQLNNTPSEHIRVTWTNLPPEIEAASAGMIFEAPWSNNRTSRIVVGCSVDARWADGTVDAIKGRGTPTHTASPETWGRQGNLITPFRPPNDESWSQITLDESWLRFLTPSASPSLSRGAPSDTTLEIIFTKSDIIDDDILTAKDQTRFWNQVTDGSSNRTIYLEWITALLIADGISRQRTYQALNTTGRITDWELLDYQKLPGYDNRILQGGPIVSQPVGTSFTTHSVEIDIQGLAYQAQSTTDYLAIAVLLTHILLALGHIMYTLWRRQTSAAWDTITEVIALAHNSRPSRSALQNTSAGISILDTYKRVAVVRATEIRAGTENRPVSRVELIFKDDDCIPPAISPSKSFVSPESSRKQVIATSTWPSVSPRSNSPVRRDNIQLSHSSEVIPLVSYHPSTNSSGVSLENGVAHKREVSLRITPDHLYA